MDIRHSIRLKLGADRWIACSGTSLDGALEQWKAHAAKPPAESSGYYHGDWDTWYELKEHCRTLTRGA
jgi:hypothetical protein